MARTVPSAPVVALFFVWGASGCSKRSPPPAPAPPSDITTTSTADLAAPPSSAAPEEHEAAPVGPWNVVLVSIDSLRADMPWAGYPRPIAPRLSDLYSKSIAYARAYSTSSFTSKSVPGMLTGKLPSELDRSNRFFTVYHGKKDFFCTDLDARGIPCVGAHAHAYFGKGQSGFDHGFRKWELVPGITFDYQTDPYVTSHKLTPLAIEMLREAGAAGTPFFAWFHYMDPHDQYQTHEESPHFGKRPRDRYDEEVFYTDLWVGRLLDFIEAAPWGARTVVAITADHGEAFGEHGVTRHAHEVWEELVHVPLFFHVPKAKPRVIATPRGHADLVPTFLELLGAPKNEGLRGESLVGELRGGEAKPRDVVVDLPEDDYNERRRALIHGRYKLIAFGNDVRFSLFDLETDPREETDLHRKRPELADEMKQRYREASSQIRDVPPRGGIQKKP